MGKIVLKHRGQELRIDPRNIYEVYAVRGIRVPSKFIVADKKGIQTIFDNLTENELEGLRKQYERQVNV